MLFKAKTEPAVYIHKGKTGDKELLLNTAPKPGNNQDLLCLATAFGHDESCFPFLDFQISATHRDKDDDRRSFEYCTLAIEMFQQIIETKNEDAALVAEAKMRQQEVRKKLENTSQVVMTQRFDMTLEMKGSPLEDFPRSEHWRFVTDGWQQNQGITGFRDRYYKGMQEAFNGIKEFIVQKNKQLDFLLIELIHDLLFQFENEGNKLKNKGYRENRVAGHFYLAPFSSTERMGISKNGLKKFIADEHKAKKDKRWTAFIAVDGDDSPAKDVVSGKTKKADVTEQDLEIFLDPPPGFTDELLILTKLLPRSKVQKFIEGDLASFYKQMKSLDQKKESPQKTDEKLKLIADFISDLNKNHWFTDGNGRTCMMIFFMLMVQHVNAVAILNTPAHFTAFPTDELVAEIKAGMAEADKYKITAPKKILLKLNETNLDAKQLESDISNALCKEPHIAMAQINELFLQVKEGKIGIKEPAKQNEVFRILKELYLKNLNAFCENPPKGLPPKVFAQNGGAFEKMFAYQEITKELDPKLFNLQEIAKLKNKYFEKTGVAQQLVVHDQARIQHGS